MSDSVKDLEKSYEENVFHEQYPRSVGLFTIPEYPEYEPKRGMWSAAFDAILTTLRYLTPATLLTLFWGQQSFFFKILKHIDCAFRAIVFSSEEQKQAVLQWMTEVGPVKVEQLDTIWQHGWILCRVLDASLPGACAGHPATRLSLKHAQAIADHYLGVEPVFSRQELESNDSLNKHQEWKLATYLDRIRQGLAKLTPPVSKPTSQRTSPETTQFTFDYVAKGSGLTAAQVNNKMCFKIYPTAQQSIDPGEIAILIRGPKDTYGMTVFPPLPGKAQMIRQKLLGLHTQQNYTENALPITHGATYFRSYGKNNMNKTYFIPKTKYDIEIEVNARADHAKVSYVVNIEGQYEISITSRGQNIVGSPFSVSASNNIIGILEKESFCLEDGEEIDIVDIKSDRKVILRIVDFVTEKMLLKENGSLEKITDEEAKMLMATDLENETSINDNAHNNFVNERKQKGKKNHFNKVAHKVLKMNRICKMISKQVKEKQLQALRDDKHRNLKKSEDIPDIVNSTFSETNTNPFILTEKKSKLIVPESISVSIRTEKSKLFVEEELFDTIEPETTARNIYDRPVCPHTSETYENPSEHKKENIFIDRLSPMGMTNPFVNSNASLTQENNSYTFIISEYETNNSQSEETRDNSIKVIGDQSITTSSLTPSRYNPFLEDGIKTIQRPKSPVFKILSGENDDYNYPQTEHFKSELIPDEMLGNEFVNPFFAHGHQRDTREQLPIADFIIGAPVSLPPIIRSSSPTPGIKSLMIPAQNKQVNSWTINNKSNKNYKNSNELTETKCLTPEPFKSSKSDDITGLYNTTQSLVKLHSMESNVTETVKHLPNYNENQHVVHEGLDIGKDDNNMLRKETWDSAYVSIDDNNSTPDNNNNDNITIHETNKKQKTSACDASLETKKQEHLMGPAEREIWKTCCKFNDSHEQVSASKREPIRAAFTPIIEESDKSNSSRTKDIPRSAKKSESDEVSVAFAELNEIYTQYFPVDENSFTAKPKKDNKLEGMKISNSVLMKRNSVDSASEKLSDVKRHNNGLEGTISEVQLNVAESFSVSQTLLDETTKQAYKYTVQPTVETLFGDRDKYNIVSERKKYWDDKIQQLEAKSQEAIILPKKKRVASSKQMKHDSLSKRKGKQMIKKFLNAGGYNQAKHIQPMDTTHNDRDRYESTLQKITNEHIKADEKIVEKWKQYWDDKLLKEHGQDNKLQKTKSHENQSTATKVDDIISSEELLLDKDLVSETSTTAIAVKQELPEEVFKAFETSPKRFFGTSRKQILSKIDIFSARSSSSEEPSPEIIDKDHESGLVSSRITLFHTLSNTEELPWVKRKSKSMHNIYHSKENNSKTLNENKYEAQRNATSVLKTDLKRPVSKSEHSSILDNKCNDIPSKPQTQNIHLNNKKAVITDTAAVAETVNKSVYRTYFESKSQNISVPRAANVLNLNGNVNACNEALRKKSFSKSEMDIFSKVPDKLDNGFLEKYKSCDELPRINVKSFISLYEGVSQNAVQAVPKKQIDRTRSVDSEKLLLTISDTSDTDRKCEAITNRTEKTINTRISDRQTPDNSPRKVMLHQNSEKVQNKIKDRSLPVNTGQSRQLNNSKNAKTVKKDDKETTYVSLSDMELEIIESCPDKSIESSPERETVADHVEYSNRFKLAKQYFQSLEELREVTKPKQLNECELLLKKSNESLENMQPQRRKKKHKSHSMPSSEISKVWSELQENKVEETDSNPTKLVKISEKFNVDDLFSDVMEGRLSRQGSLKGIPNKRAVLETFRSMENIADNRISSYEITDSQLNDFTNENCIKNAQTYLKDYPYLPTTDPSKYHSRVDVQASGLISFKELLQKRPRRNSVPDLRLNAKFTENL